MELEDTKITNMKNKILELENKIKELEHFIKLNLEFEESFNIVDEVNINFEVLNRSIPSIITNKIDFEPPIISRQYAFNI